MEQTGRDAAIHKCLSLPPWKPIPRHEVAATVVEHRPIIGHEYEIVFNAPAIARTARAGQFVEILFGDSFAPLVRRPFSIYRVDTEAGTCSVLYLARGSFTSGLARKREGDIISLLGPLGRPFHWTDDQAIQHILIAGGLGAPPLYFLARELSRSFAAARESEIRRSTIAAAEACSTLDAHAAAGFSARNHDIDVGDHQEVAVALSEAARSRLIVINAARTESLLVGISEFGDLDLRLHVMTDDGSQGAKGMATELLTELLAAEPGISKALYACGPMPMLRSVGEIAIANSIPCQLSIETTMPCGIGLCQGCVTPVRDSSAASGHSYALACIHGPVFEARDLVW